MTATADPRRVAALAPGTVPALARGEAASASSPRLPVPRQARRPLEGRDVDAAHDLLERLDAVGTVVASMTVTPGAILVQVRRVPTPRPRLEVDAGGVDP